MSNFDRLLNLVGKRASTLIADTDARISNRGGQQRSGSKWLSGFMMAMALVVTAPAANATIVSGNVSYTLTGNGACDLDTSNTDNKICTNANITYKFERTNDSTADAPITYVSTLPMVGGQPVADWRTLPPECNGPGSGISANGQTLTCVLTTPPAPGTNFTFAQATVRGTVPNGTSIPTPVTTFSSPTTPSLTATNVSSPIQVQAKPRYDATKRGVRVLSYPGPGGEPGFLLVYAISLRAPQGPQGVEALSGPLVFTDAAPRPDASIVTWGPAAGRSCVGNRDPAHLGLGYGDEERVYDWPRSFQEYTDATAPDTAVTDPGTCAIAQPGGAGGTSNITITGANLTTGRYPDQDGEGNPLPAGDNFILAYTVTFWVPASSFPSGTTYIPNTINVSGTSISGQPNVEPSTSNNMGTVEVRNTTTASYFRKSYDPASTGASSESGNGYFVPGQNVGGGVAYVNTDSVSNVVTVCDKIDNLRFLPANFSSEPLASGGVLEYGTGGRDGLGSTWASEDDMRQATCADNQSPTWYTSLASVPGGAAAVTKVRFRDATINPGQNAQIFFNLTALDEYAASGWGGAVAGAKLPIGEFYDNWATYSLSNATSTTFNTGVQDAAGKWWSVVAPGVSPVSSNHGDRATLARVLLTTTKRTLDPVAPATSVVAGSTVKYEIRPIATLPVGGLTMPPTTVTVTDILPPGVTYVAGSATAPGSTGAPTVQNNVPATGYTTLTWTFNGVTPAPAPGAVVGPIVFDAVVDPFTPNGKAVVNVTGATSPAMPFIPGSCTDPNGTGIYDGYMQPGYSINFSGITSIMCRSADKRGLTVSTPGGLQVSKAVLTPEVAPNSQIRFQLNWGAIGATVNSSDLIDVFPYNGDGRTPASNITGTFQLASAPVLSNDGTPATTLYYSSATPSSIQRDPSHASNALPAGTTKWCMQAEFGSAGCPANFAAATAVRFVSTGTQADGDVRSAQLAFNTTGNTSGNVYSNDSAIRGVVNNTPTVALTGANTVTARVVTPPVTVKKTLTAESGATAGVAEANEQLTYTLTLTNAGTSPITNHQFYEVLPLNTTMVSIAGATTNCAAGDAGAKLCTITVAGPIPANGGTATATFAVRVVNPIPAGVTQILNLVTDNTDTPPPTCNPATQVCTPPTCDPATDPDHCVVTPVGSPAVTVKKVLSTESGTVAGFAEAGETLTYTLTLTNAGTAAATNHQFFEVLPENTTLVSIAGAGVTSTDIAGNICGAGAVGGTRCTITVAGPIAANGGTATATVIVTVVDPIPAGVTNVYNLITDNTDTPPSGCENPTEDGICPPLTCDPATDPNHCVVTPIAPPAVTVAKALTAESGTAAGFAEAGEQLTYTLTLTNVGTGAANNHAFFEVLPVNTTLVSITGTGVTSNCAAGDAGAKLCTITVAGPIAANGGTATATVIVTVADPLPAGVTQILNLITDNTDTPPTDCDPVTQVCVNPPTCDPATDPNHCVVTPIAPPAVTVAKALTAESGTAAGFAEAGEQLTYTLTLTNAGTGAANNHAFFEVLPVNTTLVSITGTGVTSNCAAGDAGAKLCTITVAGPIAANGGMATATVIVTVADPLPAGVTQILNLITDNTDTPPTDCDPVTQVCVNPPTCDPATDPNHCVVTPIAPPAVTVAKALTAESGTAAGFAEAGEQLTYTLTLTNAGTGAANNHAFFEVLPVNTTLVSITGTGVTSNCAAGDAGAKLCTITVAGPIAANGGMATATVIVTVADPLPAGVTQILNLITDNTDTPPTDCDPVTQVCVNPPTCDPATDPNHCVVTPVAPPAVTVAKALTAESGTAAGFAEAGEQLTYTLTATNAGQGAATNHAFFEQLPANTTLVSITGGTSNCAAGDAGTKLCTITIPGSIAPGASVPVTVIVTVADPIPAGVVNVYNLITDNTDTPPPGCDPVTQVCVNPPTCDPATDPNHCVVTPIAPPAVTVAKALTAESGTAAGFAEAGEQLTYTLTLTNAGTGAANNHAFFEVLPVNTTLVSIAGTGVTSNCAAGDAGAKLCTITVAGPIAANGGMATATVIVTVADPLPAGVTQILNLITDNTDTPPTDCDPVTQVCVNPPTCDPATDPNHCVVTPVAPPAVTVAKALTAESGTAAGFAEAGEQLTYTLTATNAGQGAATNHAFFEQLPANTTLVSITGGTSNCAAGDAGTKLCTITIPGSIAPGASVPVTVIVTVADPIPAGVVNVYNLITDNTDTPPPGCDPVTQVCTEQPPVCDPQTNICTPPPVCNPATDPNHCVVTPVAPPAVTVAKALTAESGTAAGFAEAGEQLTYTLTATNAGQGAATNHAFFEQLPANTTLVSITGGTSNCAAGDAGTKLCTITIPGSIAPGASVPVTVIVTVVDPLPAGVTNVYNLITDNTDTPPPGCNPATQVCTEQPPVCDPQTNICTPPPVCNPATDPTHCVVTPVAPPAVTVAKALTAESGTAAGFAEAGEQLTYTLTATNGGQGAATNHAFFEQLPANTTLVSIAGTGVTSNCAAGDAGAKLCTITVAGPIAANGGTATATVIVTVANPLPAGVTNVYNLITDNTDTPPPGCNPATQVCTEQPPVCDPVTNVCTPPPVCNPATDPTHCVVTPIAPAAVTVKKVLTGESGTAVGFAEAGEQLTYTLTLLNSGKGIARNHAFFEVLPVNTTLVSITGTGVTSNCAAGDVGAKLCTINVAGPIAADGGTAEVKVVVTVADPLPAGVTQVLNLITDTTTTPPVGCDPVTQICTQPPTCDPATDPDHCVVTPVAAVLALEKTSDGVPTLVAGSADTYTVKYNITVTNSSATAGTYSLIDTPQFEGDATILSATSQRGSDTINALTGAGPWTLATDRSLAPGQTEVYAIVATVRVAAGSDQANDKCVAGTPGNGLFNTATMTSNGKTIQDDACVETPKPATNASLVIEKTGSVREAEVGDIVNYSVRIRNNGTAIALLPVLVDRLPAGFQVIEGSVSVRGATLVSVDGIPGPVMRVTMDRINPGAEVVVSYRTRIGVGAQQGDGINTAQVECRETPTDSTTKPCSNESKWKVELTGGVFDDAGCIAGQVFVDCNYNSMKDKEELGIPGVRIYMENGTYFVSDVEGKYSYCGIRPTTHVLKVDQTTLPTRSRLVTSSNRNVGDANSIFVDLKNGELQRADFIEGSCNNEVIEQVKARRAQGEVSSVQTEAGQPALKFEAKRVPQSNPTQQGTDSANQPIERTRQDGNP